MSINGPEELQHLRKAGQIVRRVLEAMREQVRPGVTTLQLDQAGARLIEEEGVYVCRFTPARPNAAGSSVAPVLPSGRNALPSWFSSAS